MLNTDGKSVSESPVSPQHLGALVKLIDEDVISAKIAKAVFDEMAQTGEAPGKIVEKKGLVQVTDHSELEGIVNEIIKNNPDEVAAFRGGKTKLMGFFVGQVMRETKGKANPKIVNRILNEKLA